MASLDRSRTPLAPDDGVPVVGKGQRPVDVNKLLTYIAPSEVTTALAAGTTQYSLIVVYGDAKKFDRSDQKVREWHWFFTVNGYLQGNGPMFTMRQGERVRWYVFTNTNEIGAWDIHTPHWHGQTVVANHMRTDMIMLTPMMTAMADMVPDNPGIWLFHCHMPGHFGGGMYARFNVLPAAAATR